jgi:hypothetical protein
MIALLQFLTLFLLPNTPLKTSTYKKLIGCLALFKYFYLQVRKSRVIVKLWKGIN